MGWEERRGEGRREGEREVRNGRCEKLVLMWIFGIDMIMDTDVNGVEMVCLRRESLKSIGARDDDLKTQQLSW